MESHYEANQAVPSRNTRLFIYTVRMCVCVCVCVGSDMNVDSYKLDCI